MSIFRDILSRKLNLGSFRAENRQYSHLEPIIDCEVTLTQNRGLDDPQIDSEVISSQN